MKRNTVQKDLIKKIVLASCEHPTAEGVYASAREVLPNISLGTVYRVLHELVEAGDIIEVPVSGRPSRFDKTTGAHAHFVCKKCGEVRDVALNVAGVMAAADAGESVIEDVDIVFEGVCENCNGKHDAIA